MYMSVFATDGWTIGPELEVHLEAIYVGFCLTPRQTLTVSVLHCFLQKEDHNITYRRTVI
jgi:hypothetical protein